MPPAGAGNPPQHRHQQKRPLSIVGEAFNAGRDIDEVMVPWPADNSYLHGARDLKKLQ